MRGTRAGIEAVLRLCGHTDAVVVDFGDGRDEALEQQEFGIGPKPAHFFGVILTVNKIASAELAGEVRRACAVIDREKPAHTFYALRLRSPAMRINNDPNDPTFGPGIKVGVTTTLGTTSVTI
jgi:hypothetical protein